MIQSRMTIPELMTPSDPDEGASDLLLEDGSSVDGASVDGASVEGAGCS
ncbi:MAG: hypothetical protein IPP25_19800 [Saprospiraceae bacterium]|nr:hypothetical protein [Candidatus Opimibacter skivensis]